MRVESTEKGGGGGEGVGGRGNENNRVTSPETVPVTLSVSLFEGR